MSELLNLNRPTAEEQDEIDAFNDETFGGDLADDWEDVHDKLTSFSSQIENSEDINNQQKRISSVSNIESFINLVHSNNKAPGPLIDECEDIIKKSISNFILDDDLYDDNNDICSDFTKYEYVQSTSLKSDSKVDKKNINLESLRPPSPSILPFDDPFMSSVWRPLSPELISQQLVNDPRTNFRNESQILTLEELEKNLNGHNDSIASKSNNAISKTKVFRLEDLEAQLLDNKPKVEATPNAAYVNTPDIKNSNSTPVGAYVPEKMPPNIMEIAAMSLSKLSLPPAPSIIPPPNKILPPPPGLGSKFNLSSTSALEAKSPVPSHAYIPKLPTQKSSDSFQSQMAMANAMASALANFSQLPTVRPPTMPTLPGDMKMSPQHTGLVLDPLVQQEQQRIISKIITPAQAQRIYPSHMNNFLNPRNQDKFAGFMTQKEKDWLVKIFRLQCNVNFTNSTVENYYEVNFKVNQAILERRKNLAKQHNKNIDDGEIDSIIQSEPLIVLPELAKVEEEKPKYIQFDNTLGKIQVLNTKCPRKLLDVNPEKVSALKLDSYRTNLMKIERLYEYLLNIEDEDKRMPILPERVIPVHRQIRIELCEKLFKGLVIPISTSKDEGTYFTSIQRNMPTLKRIDLEIDQQLLNINKGLALVYRSLFQLREENQLVVLISSLVKGVNYSKYVLNAEKTSKTSYGNMLVKALARIEQTRNLIYIAAAIDNFHVIVHNKYGYQFLFTLFKQYQASNDKLLFIYFWKLFVQTLIEQLSDCPELRQLCIEHFQYLAQL